MTRSDSTAKLAEALAKAQAVMEGASKDATNPHFRSKYADLASVWEACRKPLTQHGLSVAQFPQADGPRVTVTTLLMHSSGEWISGELSATAKDDGPQAVGSVITYLRRYGLSAVAGVAPEDDDAEKGETRTTGYTVTPQTQTAPHATNAVKTATNAASHGQTISARLTAVKAGRAGSKGELVTEQGEAFLCYDPRAVALAEQACQDGVPVLLELASSTSGNRYVKSVKRVSAPTPAALTDDLDADAIPFAWLLPLVAAFSSTVLV